MESQSHPVMIIAEAGVNHNGDPDMAFRLVDVAAQASVDAIKFQTFCTENIVTKGAPKAKYQMKDIQSGGSQYEMLSNLSLDHETFRALKQYSEEKGLLFMSTAFDSTSLNFLSYDLHLNLLKIPSGEITNGPLLLEFARTKRKLILSTGMATLVEVGQALKVLAFGLIGGGIPTNQAFEESFQSKKGQEALKKQVTLLHCTTEYPAPIENVNLKAMCTMRDTFNIGVGYSDHTQGELIAKGATALGAVVIEKHFTLDRTLPGPDHSASLEPDQLKQYVQSIRKMEVALGKQTKEPSNGEIENRSVVRKSLVAAKDIVEGEHFSQDNLTAKRPGDGRSPMDYWSLVGQISPKAYKKDDLI